MTDDAELKAGGKKKKPMANDDPSPFKPNPSPFKPDPSAKPRPRLKLVDPEPRFGGLGVVAAIFVFALLVTLMQCDRISLENEAEEYFMQECQAAGGTDDACDDRLSEMLKPCFKRAYTPGSRGSSASIDTEDFAACVGQPQNVPTPTSP